MIDEIKTGLLRLIAVVIICCTVSTLCSISKFSSMMRMILGIVIITVFLQPIQSFDPTRFSLDFDTINFDAEKIIAQGSGIAQSALDDITMERTCQYIEEKAQLLGADIAAEVDVRDGLPVAVTIVGDISPYIRARLSSWLAAEIGISREAQYWR